MTHAVAVDRPIPLSLVSCARALLNKQSAVQALECPFPECSDPDAMSGSSFESAGTVTLAIEILPRSTPEWSDAELTDIMAVLALGHSLPHSASPFSYVPSKSLKSPTGPQMLRLCV